MAAVRVVDVDLDGHREQGLLLPMSAPRRWQAPGFGMAGIVFLGLAVALVVSVVAQGDWAGIIGVLITGAFGTVFGLAAVAILKTGKDTVPGIRLTPIRVAFEAADQLAVPWEQVSGLRLFTVAYGTRWPRPWNNWISVEVHDPAAVLLPANRKKAARLTKKLRSNVVFAVPDRRLRMNPLLAYHAMRYYLNHPAHRRELSGEAGVQRVRELAAGELSPS